MDPEQIMPPIEVDKEEINQWGGSSKQRQERDEYDKHMCERFPKIFRERNLPMNQTCMCWGFDIQRGWYKLVEELCEKLQLIDDTVGFEVVAVQVKEKFARVCFYFNVIQGPNCKITDKDEQLKWYNIISDIVDHAEAKSYHICEECGNYGEVRNDFYWIQTLCDKHYEEEKKIQGVVDKFPETTSKNEES